MGGEFCDIYFGCEGAFCCFEGVVSSFVLGSLLIFASFLVPGSVPNNQGCCVAHLWIGGVLLSFEYASNLICSKYN